MYNDFIYGKNPSENIVSIEPSDGAMEVFFEENGLVHSEIVENHYWILAPRNFDGTWTRLKGDLYYKWGKKFLNIEDWRQTKRRYYKNDIFALSDLKEASMLLNGVTYFKGMKVQDVSILSFDIESTGLKHDKNSNILIFSNTFRNRDKVVRKLFCIDEYESQKDMIDAWCSWVREMNPSIMCGHNIFGYDLPYIEFCAKKNNTSLALGRDGSNIKFDNYTAKFRKDGTQAYEYHRCNVYGREIIDTMFLAYHYDFARKYDSYGLKPIIKQEGLEIAGRQHYDAANIAEDWKDLDKRKLIKRYAEHDADDALALYDLMIPSYFYLTQSVPKSFQAVNYSATGSQINAFLVRSYLQEKHSIPKANEAIKFPGAISDGMPGIYKNVFKVDVASLYPSIMLQYKVFDPKKDPNAHFMKMVEYFTKDRLENKAKAKETGDRYYKDMEQSRKIFINSAYGLLGSTGLHFNSPANAALVTEKGREILKKAIVWATGKEYIEKSEQVEEVDDENL